VSSIDHEDSLYALSYILALGSWSLLATWPSKVLGGKFFDRIESNWQNTKLEFPESTVQICCSSS